MLTFSILESQLRGKMKIRFISLNCSSHFENMHTILIILFRARIINLLIKKKLYFFAFRLMIQLVP